MCGIFGIAGREESIARDALALFRYRGPDSSAVYVDDVVTLGHNRLAIIDLDERSSQPLWSADGIHAIVFNGEIYNYQSLRDELESSGEFFTTESDTEVLLAGFRRWGKGIALRVSGMYAFAVYDKTEQKLTLVTDHANIKPLFVLDNEGVFAFASEIKGLLSVMRAKNIPVEIDKDALDLYWVLGYVPAPRTIYKHIVRLPRASWAEYDISSKFFTVTSLPEFPERIVDEDELARIIEKSVMAHTVADVPVGVFFSGGTDSSLIVSILHKHGVNLKAFSVEVTGRPTDKKYFDAIARKIELPLSTYHFGVSEFDDIYEDLMSRVDEPLADNGFFLSYFLAKEARKEVTVALSGEGGDEYFLGYKRHVALAALRDAPLDGELTIWERAYFWLPSFRGKNMMFARLFVGLRLPLAYYLVTMSVLRDCSDPRAWRAAKKILAVSGQDPLALDARCYLEHLLLRKLDLATMYASIEGRVPLLAPEVLATASKLRIFPTSENTLKKRLKSILAHYLPSELVYRPKTGFGLNMETFLKKSLYFSSDARDSYDWLLRNNLLPMKVKKTGLANAHLAFQCVILARVLRNGGIED